MSWSKTKVGVGGWMLYTHGCRCEGTCTEGLKVINVIEELWRKET